jgi:RNA-binding protein
VHQTHGGEWMKPPVIYTPKGSIVENLKSYQKKFLRGLAHDLKPIVFIGQKGITPTLLESLNQALSDHELIKIKFIEFKEKEHKKKFMAEIEAKTGCQEAGIIGHMAIVFRSHADTEKRKIVLPKK